MFPRALSIITLLLGAVLLFAIAAFKIVDSDFWWHIKAGEVFFSSGWITTDPFAYTREGLPYIATHEWLAQIILHGIFSLFGPVGIAMLRWISMLAIGGLMLSLDRRHVWPNVFLIVAGFIVARQGLIERPQLFTNVLFGLSVVASLNLLDASDDRRAWIRWGIALIIAQMFWVNLHGGAAFLALIVPAAVIVQMLRERRSMERLAYPILLGIGLLIAMLISPNHIHNITYVWLLFTDQTAAFIKEWSPHPWPHYLSSFGAFWIVALASLITTREKIPGSLVVLLAPGILSRTGSRHEILFVIAAIAVTVYQLSKNGAWQEFLERRLMRPWQAIIITVACIALLIAIDMPYRSFLRQTNRQGFGTEELGKGAYEFIVANNVQGPMFNTYSLGGYLLYRGHPDRKVFIDGRNVDYGYDFLRDALDARYDKVVFDELALEHGFSHAIIEYTAGDSGETPMDFDFLNDHPDWSLVYIDDAVAIYLKRSSENETLIAQREYRLLTPKNMVRQSAVQLLSDATRTELTRELLQAAKDTEDGISAMVQLSLLQSSIGEAQAAFGLAQEAIKRKPGRYEPYLAASIALKTGGRAEEAERMYEEAAKRARGMGVELRSGFSE